MINEDRKSFLEKRISECSSLSGIAREMGISRERVRQLCNLYNINTSFCIYCKKPIIEEKTRRRALHNECKKEFSRIIGTRRKSNKKFNDTKPVCGAMAAEYESRGFGVLWMPSNCEFTCVVNGHKTTLHEITINKKEVANIRVLRRRNYKQVKLSELCDIAHFRVNDIDGALICHFIVPASEFDNNYQFSRKIETHQLKEFIGRWDLFERENLVCKT